MPEPTNAEQLRDAVAAAKQLQARLGRIARFQERVGAVLEQHEQVITAAAELAAVQDDKGTRRAELVTAAGTAKVTFPIAALKLTADNLAAVRKVAGASFKKLTERVPVPFKLLKSVRDLIPALLTPAKAAKVATLLTGEASAPRITYS